MTSTTAIFLFTGLFFGLGLVFGNGIAERNPPNEPKPTRWSDKLHAEYIKGYDAGVKATLNQMRTEIKRSDERSRYGY